MTANFAETALAEIDLLLEDTRFKAVGKNDHERARRMERRKWIKELRWNENFRTLTLILVPPKYPWISPLSLNIVVPLERDEFPITYISNTDQEDSDEMKMSAEENFINSLRVKIENENAVSTLHFLDICLDLVEKQKERLWDISKTDKETKLWKHIQSKLICKQEELDILLTFFSAALFSNRCSKLCDPSPNFCDTNTVDESYEIATSAFHSMPSVSEILQRFPENRLHLCEMELLYWILEDFALYGTKLERTSCNNKNFKNPSAAFNIVYNSDPSPSFTRLKKKYGSITAFHGTRIENCWSILAYGLKNCSGTSFQSTGAAFGDGIYLAGDINVAMTYASGKCKVWGRSKVCSTSSSSSPSWIWSSIQCVFVCEVINIPSYDIDERKSLEEERYFVVNDATHCRLSMILIFKKKKNRSDELRRNVVERKEEEKNCTKGMRRRHKHSRQKRNILSNRKRSSRREESCCHCEVLILALIFFILISFAIVLVLLGNLIHVQFS
eukprot:g6435.t1